MLPLQISVPVDVSFERIGERRSTDDGSGTIVRPKQKYEGASKCHNGVVVRHIRYIRFDKDDAFELRVGGEPPAMDGSTVDAIDVKLNLALTDTKTWLEYSVEFRLDRASWVCSIRE